MSWLRIDDKFSRHPKVLKLSRSQRWTWLEVLCYCAEYQTGGKVPESVKKGVPTATVSVLNRFVSVGLLDIDEDAVLHVHDWKDYNGADAKILALERKRRQRVTQMSRTERDIHRDKNVTRAQARAPAPSPTPTPSTRGSSDVDVRAGLSGSSARESLPFSQALKPIEQDNRFDPVLALLDRLPDADAGTETILRNMRLPEFAYRNTAEQIRERPGAGVKLAVTILRRFKDELEEQQRQRLADDEDVDDDVDDDVF
jgi:hypothetical protein